MPLTLRVAAACLAAAASCLATAAGDGSAAATAGEPASTAVAPPYNPTQPTDLHKEYQNIFKKGNRNAASHRWSTFLIDRSVHMTSETFVMMFTGFCAVSGSPVRPKDYTRYRMTLDTVSGGRETGFTYYCCWPCVCDTEDFIKVDTATFQTADGPRQYKMLVLGNPCDHPEQLEIPFVQPFDKRTTTLSREAREVSCLPDGRLEGAHLSDNGYIIINMFFEDDGQQANEQDQFVDMCKQRADAGYNSGMGEIFRKVAAISPIQTQSNGSGAPAVGDGSAGEGNASGEEL